MGVPEIVFPTRRRKEHGHISVAKPSRYPGVSPTTQITHDTTFYVSAVDISLTRGSTKAIDSIMLYKNDELIKEIRKTMRAGELHREEFRQSLTIVPSDCIRVSVAWRSKWLKPMDADINIGLRDIIQQVCYEGDVSYRQQTRNIEVVISAYQSLSATTTQILQACPRFRLLICGNPGVGKTSLIHQLFGVRAIKSSQSTRGEANIEQEFTSPTNGKLVVHDGPGFEGSDESPIQIVQEFVAKRKKTPELKDQLHAIWLCLEIPYAGGRLLEAGVENFLKRRKEILGEIPFVVVLTKVDLLDMRLELDLPEGDTPENRKLKYMNEHCIEPLYEAAGNDVTQVTISTLDGYSESLSDLLKAMNENMIKCSVSGAPRVLATIAQRISIKEKIELSIAIGKKKYWNMLMANAASRGYTLKGCLQVIHKDIINVWNFNDPDQCLMDDRFTSYLLRTDNLEGVTDAAASSNGAAFASLLTSGLERCRGLAGAQDPTLSVRPTVVDGAVTPVEETYEKNQEAKEDVKILMAHIVDLICVMQIVFLSISSDRVTPDAVAFALQVYEEPRRVVHRCVAKFDAKLGALPGESEHVLEKIEELVWQYSISDHEIEELRQRMRQVVLQWVPFLRY